VTPNPDDPGSARRSGRRRSPALGLVRRQEQQTREVVATAGGAVVSAARVGRLLGRTGWRLARQLPGMGTVEAGAQRLRHLAGAEFARLLDLAQDEPTSADEQRTLRLLQDSATDTQPLRTAMTELLERSTRTDRTSSQDYLFGSIVSQLVPDEARIIAALAGGRSFAAVDVVSRHGSRTPARNRLSNASTVGDVAKVSVRANTGTYLDRLHGFGLVAFGEPTDDLDGQFDELEHDPAVQRAREQANAVGKARTVRKSVTLTPLGRQFWDACAPDRAGR
jgi:hypothetical protein